MHTILKGWGTCLDCGYEGMLDYSHVEGERYDDLDAMAFVLLLRCPACETQEHSLIAVEYYHEMIEHA